MMLRLLILVLTIPFVLGVPPGTDGLPSDLDTSNFPDPNSEESSEPSDDTLRLETDNEEYLLQETIEVKGFGFTPEAENVEVEFFGEGILVEVDDEGKFTQEYEIPITIEQGEQTIYASNHESIQEETNVTITINYPQPTIFAIPTQENETPILIGEEFLNNETIKITFEANDYETQTETDGSFEYELPKQQEGNYSVYAEQKTIPEINASGVISVLKEVPLKTFYEDNDGDGYGSEESTEAKSQPLGYVANNDDCDDDSASIFPGATETCNGYDNDCDGTIDNGATCADGTCESGVCVEEEETSVTKPPTEPEPSPEPSPQTNSSSSEPSVEQPSEVDGGFSLWWLLMPLLLVILVAGGILGYVAYEGYLDLESIDGFTHGLKKAFGMENATTNSFASSSALSTTSNAANQQLVTYIMKKRSEGYDDLTIRNALLKNNWPESEVDRTFDSLYN